MNTTQKVIKAFAICLAILIIASIINGAFYLINSFLITDNDVTINETYLNDIRNIKIDVGTTDMIIKKGDTLSIAAENVSKKFAIKEEENTLTIKEKKLTFFGNKKSPKTTITIPSSLTDLSIDIGAGKLEISEVTTDKFSLDQGAGKVTITNLLSTKTKVDGGAGELIITDSTLENLSLDQGAGKFYFSGTLLGKNKIDQGVGEVTLDLQGNDYKFEASKGLGSITINKVSYKNDLEIGEGQNIIDIDGGVGSININTEK